MSSKEDYMPANDREFASWLTEFANGLDRNLNRLGLTPESVAFVADLRDQMSHALREVTRTQAEARGAMGLERSVRVSAEKAIRPLVRRIHEIPGVDDGMRRGLRLNSHSAHRVRVQVTREAPGIHLETANGRVTIHFGARPGNERFNKRPKWAKGCIIYRKKDGEDAFQMIGYATQSPFYDEIDEPAIQVTYLARYRGRSNRDLGPESQTVSIAAGGSGLRKRARKLFKAA